MPVDEQTLQAPPAAVRGELPALPAEYALLGLIMLAGGESHGYALARQFVPGEPLAAILGLEPALIYYYLKKLARRGWVAQTRSDQPSRPARQLCRITLPGQEALRDWIVSPSTVPEQVWPEFLVKLFLADRIEPAHAQRLVRDQYALCRSSCGELTRRLGAEVALLDGGHALEGPFTRRVVQLQLLQLEAFMSWLGEAGDRRTSQSAIGRS